MKSILVAIILVITSIINWISGFGIAGTAKKMLKEKYNKDFKITQVRKLRGDAYYTVYCKNGDTFFSADLLKEGGVMFDNYDEARLCDDIIDEMSPILKEVADDFSIRMVIKGSLENYTPGNIEQGIEKNPYNLFSLRIAINGDNGAKVEPDKLYSTINKMLSIENFNAICILSFVDSETMQEVNDIIEKIPDVETELDDTLKKGTYVVTDVTDGVMQLTKDEMIDALY